MYWLVNSIEILFSTGVLSHRTSSHGMPSGIKNMLCAVYIFHLSQKPSQLRPLLARVQSLGKISHSSVFAATPTCSTHVSALPPVLCGQAISIWLAISIYRVGFWSFMCLIHFILQSTPNLPPAKNQTALLNSFHTPPSGRLMISGFLVGGCSSSNTVTIWLHWVVPFRSQTFHCLFCNSLWIALHCW